MELSILNDISSKWKIKIEETNVLSEKAVLMTCNNEEKYVLKKKGDLQQIKNEIDLLRYLKAKNLKVHYPLINHKGEFIVAYKNENYCLYKYLEGQTFNALECLQNPTAAKLLGTTMATLHKMIKDVNISNNFPVNDLYNTVYGWAVKEIIKIDSGKEVKILLNKLESEFKITIGKLPKQLIHRDAHTSNIIYKNNDLSGIIDFDLCEVNVRIFDICYCSTSILNEVFYNVSLRNDWLSFIGILISEYTKINTLNEFEMNSIWHIMLSIQTIFMAFFANDPHLFEINKAMFIWIYENKVKIENKTTILE